jgi:hypothetical protein
MTARISISARKTIRSPALLGAAEKVLASSELSPCTGKEIQIRHDVSTAEIVPLKLL